MQRISFPQHSFGYRVGIVPVRSGHVQAKYRTLLVHRTGNVRQSSYFEGTSYRRCTASIVLLRYAVPAMYDKHRTLLGTRTGRCTTFIVLLRYAVPAMYDRHRTLLGTRTGQSTTFIVLLRYGVPAMYGMHRTLPGTRTE